MHYIFFRVLDAVRWVVAHC